VISIITYTIDFAKKLWNYPLSLTLYVTVYVYKRTFTTRGPRGPWVAHLRKRSKVTVEPEIENPRGII